MGSPNRRTATLPRGVASAKTGLVQTVRLKVRVHGRHPWFYRKMVRKPEPPIAAGSAVRVEDRGGAFVGVGFYNPRTDLALRMLDRQDHPDPDALLLERIDQAIRWRHEVLGLGGKGADATTGYRLVHSEGDDVPGLVLDRLGEAVVAQVFSLCVMQRIEAIGERLLEHFPGARMALGADDTAREREGFEAPPRTAPFETEVREHGLAYRVRPGQDHKTGFFADQRHHRRRVGELARARRVLDLCCNSGGFALNAARGGAKEVVAVDLDEAMVEQATSNAKANGLSGAIRAEHGDAFEVLREAKPGSFDFMVLDPPKWITGKVDPDDQGARRYRDLNELAFRKIAPGGIVVTCSCSGALSEAKFLAILTDAAARADKDVRTIEIGGAGADHPVSLACPQTRYLKTCVLGVGAPRVRQPGGGPSGGRRTKAEAPKQQGRRGKPRRGPRSH